MEYFIKDIVMGLISQRNSLNEKIISLDQNCNSYSIKCADLTMQINKIDMEVSNMIFVVKNNNIDELNIKNNGSN